MTSLDIGKKLIELCKQGKNIEAITGLYSPEIVSIEAAEMPGMKRETHGIDAIKAKNKWWGENHEVHSAKISGPFPNGDRFAVLFDYDVTSKQSKERFKMEEVALYTVQNGKIAREEFFYAT